MIPYFHFEIIDLGLFQIHVWGLMVALGFLAGLRMSLWVAQKQGISKDIIYGAALWLLFGAIIGSRLGHVLFYEWSYYAARPLEVLKLWEGGQSFVGAFLGAFLAFGVFIRIKKIPLFPLLDICVLGVPLGIAIGRIGCFLTHMHPGIKTDFWLGVQYPDGGRHDLGLYLAIHGLAMFLIFLFFLRRRYKLDGLYFFSFLILYGMPRFFLDFLRIWEGANADARYGYLTFAQYISLAFIIIGAYNIIMRLLKNYEGEFKN